MKAKELIKILKDNPEAEVVIPTYTGCLTPHLLLKRIDLFKSGDQIPDFDATNSGRITKSGSIKKGSVFILNT